MKRLICLLLTLVCLCSTALADELPYEIPEQTDAMIKDLNTAYAAMRVYRGEEYDMSSPPLYNVDFLSNGMPIFYPDDGAFYVLPVCMPSMGLDGVMKESVIHNVNFTLWDEGAWERQAEFVGYLAAYYGGRAAYEACCEAMDAARQGVARAHAESDGYYKTYEIAEGVKLKVTVDEPGSEGLGAYAEMILDFATPWEYVTNLENLAEIAK